MLRNSISLRFLVAAFLYIPGAALFGFLAASIAISAFGVAEEIATFVGAAASAALLAGLLWKFRLEVTGEPQQVRLPPEGPGATRARKSVLWYIARAYLLAMGGMSFAIVICIAFPKGVLSARDLFAFVAIPGWIFYMAVFFLACEFPPSGPPRFRPRRRV